MNRLRPPAVDDEFFGRLTYMKMRAGSVSYWEAKRAFEPIGREIELFIDAPAPLAPPNSDQRRFYENVASRYRDILLAIEPLLRREFEAWVHQPMTKAVDAEFTLTSFSIPVPSAAEPEWDMSFDSTTDPNHLFTVTLRGQSPQSVTIDG
jgi:hypothetical protein